MTEKTMRFCELWAQVRCKADMETQRDALMVQLNEQKEAVVRLEKDLLREQEDIDDLQRKSLKSLFYGLTGKKEQKLEQERKEADAARRKYEAILRELKDTEYRLNRVNVTLAELEHIGEEFSSLLRELLIAVNDEETEQQISLLDRQRIGIADTRKEIGQVQNRIDEICSDLMEADRWASSLQFGGGDAEARLLFDALDNARRKMGHLQVQIEQLNDRMSMLNLETEITYHANILSGFQSQMMSATAAKQMLKHAHGQNHAAKAALQGILEQLDHIQAKTERQLDICCTNLIRLAEKR